MGISGHQEIKKLGNALNVNQHGGIKMNDPMLPKNIDEIPSITFQTIKSITSQAVGNTPNKHRCNKAIKKYITKCLPQKDVPPSEVFKILGVDYIG